MDIRFKGASLQHYERTLNTAVSQEDTLETIVPDALPDVAELLLTDGQSLIRGKDVHRSGVSVSGLSELNVLYRAEDGSIARLPVDIPFETEISFNVPDDASKIAASVRLTGGEARILNSRKLLLRAEVCITLSVWSPVTLRWAEEATAEGCSVEIKTERGTFRPVCAVEEKTFTVEDKLTLPAGKPQAAALLYSRAALQPEEAEQVGHKLVARGIAEVTALYRTGSDELASADFRLPWSAFLELPEAEEELSWELVTALTGCSGELTEDGAFSFTVGGVVQAAIRSERELSWIADAYGTDCAFSPVFETAELDGETETELRTESVSLRLDSMERFRSIVSLSVCCGRPRAEKENLRISVSAKALCLTEDGSLEALAARGECLYLGSGSMPEVFVGDVSAAIVPGGVELRCPLSFRQTRCRRSRLHFLSGAEVAEAGEKEKGPNVILLRTCEGDSVWSLGKKKGIACASIRSYNQLAEGEEPAPGSLLLLAR